MATATLSSTHAPSTQQSAFLDYLLTSKRSVNLKARAGCGKTSTILMALGVIPSTKRIFIGVYSAAICKEIASKVESLGFLFPQVVTQTFHASCWGIWRKVHPGCKIAGKDGVPEKVPTIIDAAVATPNVSPVYEAYRTQITRMVSHAKNRAFGFLKQIDDQKNWFDIIEHFGIDEDVEGDDIPWEEIIRCSIVVYKRSLKACPEVVDFDDMILAPLFFKCRFWTYDFVFIDEAQDTNSSRRAAALAMLKPGTGRLIAVGDPAQAIFGFTGADSDSMDIIAKQLSSVEMPLTVTYRCGKSIVRLAQEWVPDIVAAEGNPEGIVRRIPLELRAGQTTGECFATETLQASDVILCRNTKPLVEQAYSLIRRGIGCYVEGREIGKGLIKLIRRWKAKKISTLITAIEAYKEVEVQKWLAKEREAKAEQVADQCDTVIMLGTKLIEEDHNDVEALVAFINSMFGDTPDGTKPAVLTLCTIHRSKGREWKRVYLLGRDKYQPSKYARKDWQMDAERNLIYVAVTRAMEELVEVTVQ